MSRHTKRNLYTLFDLTHELILFHVFFSKIYNTRIEFQRALFSGGLLETDVSFWRLVFPSVEIV